MKKQVLFSVFSLMFILSVSYLTGCKTSEDDDPEPPFPLLNTVWIGETGTPGDWATLTFKAGNEAVVLFAADGDNSANPRVSSYVYDTVNSRGYLYASDGWSGWFFLSDLNRSLELTSLKGVPRTLKRIHPSAGNTFSVNKVSGDLSGAVWAGAGPRENEWLTISFRSNTEAVISSTFDNTSGIQTGSVTLTGNEDTVPLRGVVLRRYR
jgi:hypothetical protein